MLSISSPSSATPGQRLRGVAMNPVDHPHEVIGQSTKTLTTNRVVTINISVRPLRSQDTLHKVKRLVSLLLGELVCCAVPKGLRIRWLDVGVFS